MIKKIMLAAGIIIVMTAVCCGCNQKVTKKSKNFAVNITTQETRSSLEEEIHYKVQWTENNGKKQMIYKNKNGKTVFGPVDYIYISDAKNGNIIRYIKNGKIGFANAINGKYITQPIYTKASPMEYDLAVVKKDNNMFYINEKGRRISKINYIKAFSFEETQGNYARVKVNENTWCIIDRNEKVLLEAKFVNKLPYTTNIVTGITKKGKAFSYAIGRTDLNSLNIYKEYNEIEKPYMGKFAIVEKSGKKGVINFKKKNYKLIDTMYSNIEFELYSRGEELDTYIFRCKRKSGKIDVIVKAIPRI